MGANYSQVNTEENKPDRYDNFVVIFFSDKAKSDVSFCPVFQIACRAYYAVAASRYQVVKLHIDGGLLAPSI